jgi:ribonuclease HI
VTVARIWVDGACRGNPGPASIGALIAAPDGSVLKEISECLGVGTNNIAEYTALVRALEEAKALGVRRVEAHSDSQLLVRQMSGQYRVKHPGLRPLFARALALPKAFEHFSFTHVPREENREADRLANAALDRRGI